MKKNGDMGIKGSKERTCKRRPWLVFNWSSTCSNGEAGPNQQSHTSIQDQESRVLLLRDQLPSTKAREPGFWQILIRLLLGICFTKISPSDKPAPEC